MDAKMNAAIHTVAHRFGWVELTNEQVGLLMWALFRYYVMRLKETE